MQRNLDITVVIVLPVERLLEVIIIGLDSNVCDYHASYEGYGFAGMTSYSQEENEKELLKCMNEEPEVEGIVLEEFKNTRKDYLVPFYGGKLLFREHGEDDQVMITYIKLMVAVNKMKTEYPKVLSNIISEDSNHLDADILFQLAMYGEVKYG